MHFMDILAKQSSIFLQIIRPRDPVNDA